MKPVEFSDLGTEPAGEEFGIHRSDFRPTWDGDLVNISRIIPPLGSEESTAEYMRKQVVELAEWVLAHRNQFGKLDRFQIIIGWPKLVRENSRQAIKMGGTYEDLEAIVGGETSIRFRPGWNVGIFASS